MRLRLSAPEEVGANSAALQISDGLSGIVLFAALGGGKVAETATSTADGSHPAAFPQCSCRWRGWRWWGPG